MSEDIRLDADTKLYAFRFCKETNSIDCIVGKDGEPCFNVTPTMEQLYHMLHNLISEKLTLEKSLDSNNSCKSISQ